MVVDDRNVGQSGVDLGQQRFVERGHQRALFDAERRDRIDGRWTDVGPLHVDQQERVRERSHDLREGRDARGA